MVDATQRDSHSFWELLEACGRDLRTLRRTLEGFSKLDLCRYLVAFDNLMSEVNPHDWEECHPHLTGPCSEDHADDFAAWVVMQGEEFYNAVAGHPERIQRYLEMFGDCEAGRGYVELRWDGEADQDEPRDCQRADYLASAIYRSRYGGNIMDACYDDRGWPREGLE